jgi:hypothetical protein
MPGQAQAAIGTSAGWRRRLLLLRHRVQGGWLCSDFRILSTGVRFVAVVRLAVVVRGVAVMSVSSS